jgi:hypothetical protein
MSYTFGKIEKAEHFMASDTWTAADLGKLIKDLSAINYHYQESRSAGLGHLQEFMEAATDGGEVANTQKQFEAGNVVYSSMTSQLAQVLAGLQGSLSFRIDNEAKDTKVHESVATQKSPVTSSTSDQKGFLGQAAQDSVKRYEQLLLQLRRVKTYNGISKRSFERMTQAVWTP